jgi:prepilin-type N-terminal cleavage/methylation domain-containing protein
MRPHLKNSTGLGSLGPNGGICSRGALDGACWAGGSVGRRAFSLIEMLVASALLVVIMLGLVAMFFQTERAFRLGVVQSDTMEGGRATIELVARDLQELSSANQTNVVHFYVDRGWNGVTNELAPGEWRLNVLQPFYLLRRANLQWRGLRYDFSTNGLSPGLVTLHRLDTLSLLPADQARLTNAWEVNAYLASHSARDYPAAYGTIVDGVVNLTLKAYDNVGNPVTNFPYRLYSPDAFYEFRGTNMPAAVEVELGILDPKTLERARGLTPANQGRFLSQHAGSVHLFRQRIPIRSTQ